MAGPRKRMPSTDIPAWAPRGAHPRPGPLLLRREPRLPRPGHLLPRAGEDARHGMKDRAATARNRCFAQEDL